MNDYHKLYELVDREIYTYRVPFRFLGLPIGTRMTVIRLTGDALLIHSPVDLTPQTKPVIDQLGLVKYVVAPNNMHHLYIDDYLQHYPYAQIFAAPGLPEKRKDIKFHHVLKSEPERLWGDVLDQTVFYGHPDTKEVVFFHRTSRTLILTDLIMHLTDNIGMISKMLVRSMGMLNKPSPPPDFSTVLKGNAQAKMSAERILQWDFENIILAHGDLIIGGGKDKFREAYQWLLTA
ncbi:MAG: DUF4336 domain-containing protein [Candidatus Omnitrophica bacterium]|nr:DUF4336 domain-containing protein [Candidatus Omnitrophota bacterium]